MEGIPQQRSYELLPTEQLETAYALAEKQYWDAMELVTAASVTKAAIANVIRERRSTT